MINSRDWDYIESRLSAPMQGADEAHGRLQQVGLNEDAKLLMDAMKRFNDECRAIRASAMARMHSVNRLGVHR